MRAFLVAILIATPSFLLAEYAPGIREFVILIALIGGIMTFSEYKASYPSIVEFRDAPPINRMRYVALFMMVFCLSIICKHQYEPTNVTAMVNAIGAMVGDSIDFPYSPVRHVLLLLPADASSHVLELIRSAAGLTYLIALTTVLIFILVVRLFDWPTSSGAFNVWINMPLFDPTAGGDVVSRMQRDARINIVLGILLPFIIPAMIKAVSDVINPVSMVNPQTLIWTMSAWAFLPASLIMRGVALYKISEMIEEKRRRTYASADTQTA